jgi:cystathionine gamma-lyase
MTSALHTVQADQPLDALLPIFERNEVAIVLRRQGVRRSHHARRPDQPSEATPMTLPNRLHFATRTIHGGQSHDPLTGAVMVPIYATSTYAQESPGVHKGLRLRSQPEPDAHAFERCIADLESGAAGFAFASGLAGIATVFELLDSGAHIVATDDLYGGTFRLIDRVRRRSAGLDATSSISPTSPPSRPRSGRQPACSGSRRRPTAAPRHRSRSRCRLARRRGLLAVADNTFAARTSSGRSSSASTSSCIRRPSISTAIPTWSAAPSWSTGQGARGRHRSLQNAVGGISGPFDSFLALRGLKTLALRMQRHSENGMRIAEWLERRGT